MSVQPELESLSLTVIGSFDPGIFHPAWFKYNYLLKGSEADGIRVRIVHPEIANLSAEWFDLHALRDRLTFRTTITTEFERLCRLAHGIFMFQEAGTASVVQLRRAMHLGGHPSEAWKRVSQGLSAQAPCQDVLSNPNVRSVELEETRRDPPGAVRLRIEPSSRLDGFCASVVYLYAVREDIPGHALQVLGEHCIGDLHAGAQLLQRAMTDILG